MNVKVTLTWDVLVIGEQIIDVEEMNLDKWSQIDIRLDPIIRSHNDPISLHESTFLKVKFERVDSLGRSLPRERSRR